MRDTIANASGGVRGEARGARIDAEAMVSAGDLSDGARGTTPRSSAIVKGDNIRVVWARATKVGLLKEVDYASGTWVTVVFVGSAEICERVSRA